MQPNKLAFYAFIQYINETQDYEKDIIDQLLSQWSRYKIIDDYYTSIQKNRFDHQDRAKLVNYMADFCSEKNIGFDIVQTAIMIVDIYLSNNKTAPSFLMLLGIVAINVSMKFLAKEHLTTQNIVDQCKKAYNYHQVTEMEKFILTTLSWQISLPLPSEIANRILCLHRQELGLNETDIFIMSYKIDQILGDLLVNHEFGLYRPADFAFAAIAYLLKSSNDRLAIFCELGHQHHIYRADKFHLLHKTIEFICNNSQEENQGNNHEEPEYVNSNQGDYSNSTQQAQQYFQINQDYEQQQQHFPPQQSNKQQQELLMMMALTNERYEGYTEEKLDIEKSSGVQQSYRGLIQDQEEPQYKQEVNDVGQMTQSQQMLQSQNRQARQQQSLQQQQQQLAQQTRSPHYQINKQNFVPPQHNNNNNIINTNLLHPIQSRSCRQSNYIDYMNQNPSPQHQLLSQNSNSQIEASEENSNYQTQQQYQQVGINNQQQQQYPQQHQHDQQFHQQRQQETHSQLYNYFSPEKQFQGNSQQEQQEQQIQNSNGSYLSNNQINNNTSFNNHSQNSQPLSPFNNNQRTQTNTRVMVSPPDGIGVFKVNFKENSDPNKYLQHINTLQIQQQYMMEKLGQNSQQQQSQKKEYEEEDIGDYSSSQPQIQQSTQIFQEESENPPQEQQMMTNYIHDEEQPLSPQRVKRQRDMSKYSPGFINFSTEQ